MQISSTAIHDVKLLKLNRFNDARGYFAETYSQRLLAGLGIDCDFVQHNQSLSVTKGVVRGLHFQTPPHAQAKLLRVNHGAIYDVAVDIRQGSPTYGRHVGVTLRAEDWTEIFIPAGFAHGFCTLTRDTEIVYKVSRYYAPSHDKGLAWDDPELGIEWPVDEGGAILSDKDRSHPTLSQLPPYFRYEEDDSSRSRRLMTG
jgi:dTDP-4-dehydrorhamnose 3,5-epimerase